MGAIVKTKREKGSTYTEGYSLIPRIFRNLSERAYGIQRRFHGDKYYTWTGVPQWTDKKLINKLLKWQSKSKPVQTIQRQAKTWSEQVLEDQKLHQERCRHLKGGRFRRNCTIKDYILTHHRFIDGSERVWCQLCKKEFDPKADETKRMLEESTNRMSSSEIPVRPVVKLVQKDWSKIFYWRFLREWGLGWMCRDVGEQVSPVKKIRKKK